jgi:tetratricopeptide (TPR) repeat protein
MGLKYELGRRQFLAGKFDDAIASLQQAQRDPRRHLSAMTYLGRAFARKNLFREAAETFERALGGELTDERGKELRYELGLVLMEMEKYSEARDQFSNVAQADYNYRDVRAQLAKADEKLKAAGQG